ncbi:29534_t:CDS:2, partial [Racocetra persica]
CLRLDLTPSIPATSVLCPYVPTPRPFIQYTRDLGCIYRSLQETWQFNFRACWSTKKALKLCESANEMFQRREVQDFFNDIDHEFDVLYKNVEIAKILIAKKATTQIEETLEVQVKKRRIDEVNASETSDKYLHEATAGDTLPNGIKIKKPNRLNLISSDESSQETDNDEDIPLDESFISTSNNSKI